MHVLGKFRDMTREAGDEDVRAARLLDAQDKAAQLFAAVEQQGLIRAGVREVEASDAIRDLAAEMFGVDRHWPVSLDPGGPPGRPRAADRRVL
jgi:Xaa-Pro dipeptidase